ncbi:MULTISPECIES: helix-turn-helix transcriptional regulator [unclassified Streptomyces]|uniref:helix-turn-helix domain-containing protein n=1 Tax=unclassified Streptomyces TaxID=2593676 RepID=UPI001F522DBE|nr:helix-turn-helix transcriptional regulator [Streptomyces sp. TSRI0281]
MTARREARQTERGQKEAGGYVSAPTVRRRQLGRTLRSIREKLGLTQEEAAENTGGRISPAKLSRIETARNAASASDVEALLDLYGVSDADVRRDMIRLTREGSQRGWWQSYRSVLSPVYEDLISLEAEASTIRTWQLASIPGLLQTPQYAHAAIASTAMSKAITDRVQALVEVRLARQSVLSRSEPLRLRAIIGEAALRTRLPDASVMYDQLSRLVHFASMPNVDVQVLPITAPLTVGQTGSFSILGFGELAELSVVHLEQLTSALYVEDATQVSTYADAHESLTAAALSVEQSLDLITHARDQKP